jgi:tRNA threonylcarbamoyladenosine biosynthesis protein TsaB
MDAGHAERLLPMIQEVMSEAGCRFEDLDALALTVGPGTFTGIRIGVAAARGLALAAGLPVRATTSLHVMALGAARELGDWGSEQTMAVCMDARNGRLFAQFFGSRCAPLAPAMIGTPGEVVAESGGRPLLCVGSAAAAVAALARSAGVQVTVGPTTLLPSAADLVTIAPELPEHNPPVPLYLRPPDVSPQADKALPRKGSNETQS